MRPGARASALAYAAFGNTLAGTIASRWNLAMTSADDNMLATLSRIGAVAPEVIELFDYLEDTPLWMKDEAGHYEWANVALLLNFGVKTRAELIGRTDYDF